jgi:predicted PurR-regulated permease PerM
MEGIVALSIPIVLFVSIAAVVALLLYFRFRRAAELQKTARAAIEHGQPLSPEFLDKLSESLETRISDLRRGVIAIAIGIGLATFGLLLGGGEDTRQAMLAMGAMPIIIGVAYLGLWKFSPRE